LRPVQERGGKTTIEAALKVDHVVHVLTGVAVHEESGTGRAPVLALLGIAREAVAGSGVTDGKIESVADTDTKRPIGPSRPSCPLGIQVTG
jgi:hypothetical protein